ncbi:UDP-galactopyranose mutase [Candidatus Pacearchaeota archaeon]|nr:UDP-galactopyranose mutase [Candidatus Pacearchaeota archaeon]
MEKYDYLIVGAGFSGAILAERLLSIGKKVLVVDTRSHIGGNCYDFLDSNGVWAHKYGPHYFRTNFSNVRNYLSKFTEWILQKYIVKISVDGKLYPMPINLTTINLFFNQNLRTEKEVLDFLKTKQEKIPNPKNAEEQVLSRFGKEIYESFFKNYTIKQWGTSPTNLDASITARIPLRTDTYDSYVDDFFQAMPKDGYTAIFKNILKGVEIRLNTSFSDIKDSVEYDSLIYTGPIDEFFEHKFGKLPYRSLKFEFERHEKEFYQECVQINYPNEHDYTRIVEIKHATKQKIPATTIMKEYPAKDGPPLYPILNPKNREIYGKYKSEAEKLKNVYFIGRLAEYRYSNMDQVVKNALDLFEELKKTNL